MIGQQLLANFSRIARADGGVLDLVSDDGKAIRFAYAPGADEHCESGACVLPHLELQEMMREWLARRDPDATVTVQLARKADA